MPLCDIIQSYANIYVNTQLFLLLMQLLFCSWRHVSADKTAIFRPTYNRVVPYYIAPNMGSHIVYTQCT